MTPAGAAHRSTVPGAGIQVNLYDGTREQFRVDDSVLFTVKDGNQDPVVRSFYETPTVLFQNLPVFQNAGDFYTVIASARHFVDAGFFPVKIRSGANQIVDLLLLPKSRAFHFAQAKWNDVIQAHPDWSAFLPQAPYGDLLDYAGGNPLACLLNILTAASQIHLPNGTVTSYLREVIFDPTGPQAIARDRFFVWANAEMLTQVKRARDQGTFADAPANLHPGATRSYKQIEFGEANVQLTFHENDTKEIGGDAAILLECDIDYYRDSAAHLILEVFVNALGSLTDPAQVYALRWMAGRRAGRPEFNPLYTVERA